MKPEMPQRRPRILVVDDDPGLLRLLTIRLRAENYEVEAVDSGVTALAAAGRFRPDLVLTDLRMEPMDGIALLREMQTRWPGVKLILLTAHGTIPDAVQATQLGAFSFLTKPVEKQELLAQVERALRVSGFSSNAEEWRAGIITRSTLLEEKLAQAHMVAGTDARVLITGESGTGKELLARAIHQASPRRGQAFQIVSCGALDEVSLELELFGNRPDQPNASPGAFRSADGGSLLLDEVTEMPAKLQVKLLRVLHESAVRPVGSNETVPINVRLLATSRRDLAAAVAAGQFREDLYYRLNVVHIDVRTFPCWWRTSSRKLPPRAVCGVFMRRRRSNCWPLPTGLATCANWPTWCGKTLQRHRPPSSRLNSCSNRSRARRVACRRSTRRAMSSRAIICRRFCRLPAAMSARPHD
jgi:two-component system response regulator GlrR